MKNQFFSFSRSAFLLFIISLSATGWLSAQEICNNGLDDDADGLIDCYDPDCSGNAACTNFYFGQSASSSCIAGQASFNLDTCWISQNLVLPGSTPVAGDIDNDGVVEIVVCRGLTPGPNDTILVIDGNTGLIENKFSAGFFIGGSKGDVIGIADIDNDGFAEIVVNDISRNLRAFEHDGTPKWVSNVVTEGVVSPMFADFDQNDTTEVYAGRQIFDGMTGVLIAQGTGNRGEGQTAFCTVGVDVLPTAYCTDCDGLELVAGHQVYSVNLAGGNMTVRNTLGTGGVGDGLTAVADYDYDGDLDAIVSSRGPTSSGQARLFVWDIQTASQFGFLQSFPGNTSDYGGPPTVSDFDNDGRMEVVVVGQNVVRMFDDWFNNLGLMWTRSVSENSGVTGTCAFDFSADGQPEVVFRSEDSLYIFDGATGATLGGLPALAGTISERPTVVDHNGDGQAEILTVGAAPVFTSRAGGLMSVKPVGGIWASARSVWNQAHYFNTNINDDLTVPQVQQRHNIWDNLDAFNRQSNILDTAGIPLPLGSYGSLITANFGDSISTLTVDFSDLSFGAGVNNWGWSFGDGGSSTLQNPNHTYSSYGTYTVCLIVASPCDTDTVCRPITLAPCVLPSAAFVDSSTSIFDVQFTDQSTGPNYTHFWTFGDGTTDTSANPMHTYAAAGTYTVCLVVTNSCGSDSSCSSVVITCPLPTAAFADSSVSVLDVQFTDQSIGTGYSLNWDFGDGNSSTASNPLHSYMTADTFTVCLTVSDVCGADTTCSDVIITCPPNTPAAAFTFSRSNDTVTFVNQTTGIAPTYLWEFGDGTTSTLLNPVHVYATNDTFTACLTVTDPCGTQRVCEEIIIPCPLAAPVASFAWSITGLQLSIQDQSTGDSLSYMWTLGNDTSTAANPNLAWPGQGLHTLCLVVTNSCGTDSICDSVPIPLGLPDPWSASGMTLFPNPATASVWLEGKQPLDSEMELVWVDLLGRRFPIQTLTWESPNRIQIPIDERLSGIYFLEIRSGEKRWTQKIRIDK